MPSLPLFDDRASRGNANRFRQTGRPGDRFRGNPLEEWDLREQRYGPAEVAALAIQHLNADTAYFVSGKWDLWTFDIDTLKWTLGPQPIELICHGAIYDDGIAATSGHFTADLGFEHLFTGHGGLLAPGLASNPFDTSDHPFEKTFKSWMASSENLKLYH